MILLCKTTWLDDAVYARVELTPEGAAALLAYKAVWEAAAEHDKSLYCVEYFDGRASYFDTVLDGDHLPEDEEEAWGVCPDEKDPAGQFDEWRTAVDTLKVLATGVLWSASPKHGDGYLETPEIVWVQLQAVSEGKPFTPFE